MKPASRGNWYIAAAWLLVLGVYVAICEWVPAGAARTAAANVILCLLPLLVNGALLLNAVTPEWRKKTFWMLLALGCSLWMVGQTIWTYVEVYQHRHISFLFYGDIVFFLHALPMIAALTLRPDQRSDEQSASYGYVDFGLILCWWMYLYVFVVIPWQTVAMDERNYVRGFSIITLLENGVFIGGAALLAAQATGTWRRTYAHLAGAKSVYVIRYLAVELLVGRNAYSRGSLYDLPLLISLLWLGTTGILAYRNRGEEAQAVTAQPGDAQIQPSSAAEPIWAARLARAALLSLPLIGFWCLKLSSAPRAVHEFRILVTLGAVLPLGILAFLRHDLVDRERLRLLRASEESEYQRRGHLQKTRHRARAEPGLLRDRARDRSLLRAKDHRQKFTDQIPNSSAGTAGGERGEIAQNVLAVRGAGEVHDLTEETTVTGLGGEPSERRRRGCAQAALHGLGGFTQS